MMEYIEDFKSEIARIAASSGLSWQHVAADLIVMFASYIVVKRPLSIKINESNRYLIIVS
jgi:hypothetical protein